MRKEGGRRIKAVNRPHTRVPESVAAQMRADAAVRREAAGRFLPETWHQRVAREAREAHDNFGTWLVGQWHEVGAAAAGQSLRADLRHTIRTVRERFDAITDQGWNAIEQRIDPSPTSRAGRTRAAGGRGGGYYEEPGDKIVNDVWDAFFHKMMTSMDVSLCEGWIVADDLSEAFIQLGIPALAILEIALESRGNAGITLRDGLVVTAEILALPSFDEARDLFEELDKLKLALIRSNVASCEEDFMKKASLYAGGRDVATEVGETRRLELNGLLARAQRIAIKLTQKAFYKHQSELLIEELNKREQLAEVD